MYKSHDSQGNDAGSLSRRKAIGSVAALSAAALFPASSYAKNRRTDFKYSPTSSYHQPIYSLDRPGRSRQFTTFDPQSGIKAFPVLPGEKKVLIDYNKPGIITRLWITFSGWFWAYWEPGNAIDPTILKKFILRIYWDGNDYPSVEAPMGDFFGIGHCEYKHYLSQFLGLSSGGFYCNFPMPFQQIRVEVENKHETVIPSVFLNANYQALDTLPPDAGRFHCLYNSGTNSGTEPLTILKTRGKGHYTGCSLSIQGEPENYLSYLEAPEYFYIDKDSSKAPTLVGSGMEDYFNGGWYFREGEFAGPTHGVPLKDTLRSMVTMYRFHDQDAICFDENIEMNFLNPKPADQVRAFKFSSTAYWYQQKAVRLAFNLPPDDQLVNWYRMRDTDHQSFP